MCVCIYIYTHVYTKIMKMDVPHEKMMIKHRILGYIGYVCVLQPSRIMNAC